MNHGSTLTHSSYHYDVSYLPIALQKIQGGLNERTAIIENLFGRVASESGNTLNPHKKNQIITECNGYVPIVPLLKQLLQNNGKGDRTSKYQHFWGENQKLQRQLEDQLRRLKEIDIHIDNIVNQQFDKCNEIDEIEQTIRLILTNKQPNHIKKAEPYYEKKKQCAEYLKSKGQQKQKIKEVKYELVINIINKLMVLKGHRETGLKICSVDSKNAVSDSGNIKLIKSAIESFKNINKNNERVAIMKQEEKKIADSVKTLQQHIKELSTKLITAMFRQTELCHELERISENKNETQFFTQTFLNITGTKHLFDTRRGFNPQILIEGLEKMEKEEMEKQMNKQKIKQGIQVTNNTLEIFQHILNKIKTEANRRKQLIHNISQIQGRHDEQRNLREVVNEIQSGIDQLQIKKNRLEKHLANKVDEADVTAYKNIHRDIDQIDKEIFQKKKQIEVVRITIGENAKSLYGDTTWIQEQYSDILSEVVPSYWFRDTDFTKEQSIKDLNIYLMKTFKRLSIAD